MTQFDGTSAMRGQALRGPTRCLASPVPSGRPPKLHKVPRFRPLTRCPSETKTVTRDRGELILLTENRGCAFSSTRTCRRVLDRLGNRTLLSQRNDGPAARRPPTGFGSGNAPVNSHRRPPHQPSPESPAGSPQEDLARLQPAAPVPGRSSPAHSRPDRLRPIPIRDAFPPRWCKQRCKRRPPSL